MKILISLVAFAMTLALSTQSLAAGGAGGHGDLTEKMNALFPPKEAKPEKRDVPAKPELVAPSYFATINGDKTNLEWKAVEGAGEYHVQVATDANFKWLVANEYHVKANNFEVSGLKAGHHYYWRVAAVKPNNWDTFRKSFFATSMFATPEVK